MPLIQPKTQSVLDSLKLKHKDLKNKSILITGAARGIGEHLAYILSHLGANILIVDILDKGHDVAQSINNQGGMARFLKCDVSDIL